MPRLLRHELPDGHFHVTNRGTKRLSLFFEERAMDEFLLRLDETSERVAWSLHGFCLMPNHIHLHVECEREVLSKGMQLLTSGFARWHNVRYEQTGHHFQGRFGAKPAATTEHLLEIVRYGALNPVRAGLCKEPSAWPWSSYATLVGLRPSRCGTLRVDETRRLFAADPVQAIRRIQAFVADGHEVAARDRLEARWATPLAAARGV